jgi:GT2 family glycosyltransferase
MNEPIENRELPVHVTAGTWGKTYSVVLPTKNRHLLLGRLIRILLTHASASAEIIIVDQSESPFDFNGLGISRVAGSRPSLLYLHDSTIDGAAAARNIGLLKADSPYVIFLDDDALPEPRCFDLLVGALERNPGLLAAGALVGNYSRPPMLARWFRRLFYLGPLYDERQAIYWKADWYKPGQLIPTTKLNGGCMAFRRNVLLDVGGFDPRYRGASVAEDIEISQRLLRRDLRRDALALIGGALIYHASEGNWKNNPRALEYEIVATHYWFKKNHPWNFANRLRFYWMCLGLLLWSAASTCKRCSAAPLRTFIAALIQIARHYRDCPFLKSSSGNGHFVSAAMPKV